uniref:Si:dkey-31g6.6 n=1 Tax=Erpetoichthys calabaricus TaxID=27687 RepID=A0A8C4SV98_ERPCA
IKKLPIFCFGVFRSSTNAQSAHATPILTEKQAKQLLRSKRDDRPRKAGYPDEPMREHMLHLQQLERRAEETFLENWLNPHCYPRCNRNYGYPV